MSLNYTIPGIVNGQVSSRESDEMGAVSDSPITVIVNH